MRKFIKATSAALALTLLLAACNTDSGDKTGGTTDSETQVTTDADGTTEDPDGTEDPVAGPVHADEKEYTYVTYMGKEGTTWNPHAWETNADDIFSAYVFPSFVASIPAEDGGFEWFFEAATGIEDVTADYAGSEDWVVPEDATENYVYKIKLREGVAWEDGTEIDADAYIYSMQQLLDPTMKNYRANTYYNGASALQGARDYYESDKAGEIKYLSPLSGSVEEGTTLYFSTELPVEAFGASLEASEENYGSYYEVDGVNIVDKYKGQGVIEVTEEVQADLVALAGNLYSDPENDWVELAQVEDGVYRDQDFSYVGLLKGDNDYELIYILDQPSTEFYFLSSLTGNWIVHEELYEAGKSTVEDLVATDYATDAETTISFGPYRLVSYEPGRQMRLERNESFYGYSLPEWDNMYQADNIVYEIIDDPNTALQLFNSGQLDDVALDATTIENYRFSDYLVMADNSYTFRFVFATDPASLESLEAEAGDGSNKQVLQYTDFRKAISLSLNRTEIAQQTTAGNKPGFFLFNSLYYYDVENDPASIYRNSAQGMKVVLDLYGIEYDENATAEELQPIYDSVSGYDVEEASTLFQSVYDQAIADGTYTDGQKIVLNVMISAAASLAPDSTRQMDLVNDMITAATEGTGFEGLITVNYQTGAEDRYGDIARGQREAIIGAWGGAAFYPFSTVRVYVDADYMGGLENIHESNGWDPSTVELTLTYDWDGTGETEQTRTLTGWSQSINGAGDYATDPDISLYILSRLELAILESYQNIPIYTGTDVQLHSQKLDYYTYEYNIMYAFGGLRLYEFNYDDVAWAEYVEDQGGELNYE